MLPVVVVKINYILNMDNNNCYKSLTTTAVNANRKKTCVCCGKTLSLSYFNLKKTGNVNISSLSKKNVFN